MKIVNTVKDDQYLPIPAIHLGACQNYVVTPLTAASTPFGLSTGLIRVIATVDCYIDIGITPLASGASPILPAGISEYFGTSPGEMISFQSLSETGLISITECK